MNITENGSYSIVPNGIDEMDIEVNIPVSNVQTSKILSVDTNGNYLVSPDEGYDAIRNVSVIVDVESLLYMINCGTNILYITENSVVTVNGTATIPAERVVLFTKTTDSNDVVYLTRTAASGSRNISNVKKYVAVSYSSSSDFVGISITKLNDIAPVTFFNIQLSLIGALVSTEISFYFSNSGITSGYLS